ncbi:glycosyl hydrolase family 28 protein [Bacteroides sp.]|uniref:glycosyl hydrolase family 28 protein n=1 Tax=Bacteroides sp. TaxID=29523 RepID=UPI003AB4B6D9
MNLKFIISLLMLSLVCSMLYSCTDVGEGKPLQKERYVVNFREAGSGKAWQSLEIMTAEVDLHHVRTTYFTQLDMTSPVEVMVCFKETVRKVNIRPTHKNIDYTQKGDSIFFILNQPAYLSIEFNDDRFGNLQLFADAKAEGLPATDRNVIRFARGYHDNYQGQKVMTVPSNTTVVLEEGAVLTFPLVISHAENVNILGRGQIRGVDDNAIQIAFSKNIYIDGISLVDHVHYAVSGGQSTGITIKNLKSFSSIIWSDGIDLMSCSDVLIDNVFMRNSDDCIALYGHRWAYWGDSRNITVQNSILWADKAHPVNIASHGDIEDGNGNFLEDYTFKNIDILEHHEQAPIYQGCFAVTCGDNNTVRQLLFEDIRIENVEEGKLFYFAVQVNPEFNTVPGKAIEDITVRNVTYTPEYPNRNKLGKSVIKGFDNARRVKNFTIENVLVNGKEMTTESLETNEFVEGLIIE